MAINVRGDVLGSGSGPEGEGTVLWPATPAKPVTIPDTFPGQTAVDIDDDGTVLFQTDDGPHRWRDGTMTPLTVPDGWDGARGFAVSDGVVVGHLYRGEETLPLMWPTPDMSAALPGPARTARDINAAGLVAGDLMTWQGGATAGSLSLPPDYDGGYAIAVGEDGSVLGTLTWHSDTREFADAVVWRRG